MSDDVFQKLEDLLATVDPHSVFDFLERQFRFDKKYPHVFETMLMRMRFELGLPLIQTGPLDLPDLERRAYEEGFIKAAREVGTLYLADGNVVRAWPYFRAIGETAPVAAAIACLPEQEDIGPIVEIAFYERVHPVKGFELILHHYGTCRAISSLMQYPAVDGRDECLGIVSKHMETELVDNLKRTIAQVEGQAPESRCVTELINGREWLFENHAYYIDTSHIQSVLQMCIDLKDPVTLRSALELAEYATHLSSMYQYSGQPPFESYSDFVAYLRTLLGIEPEDGVSYFRAKLDKADLEQVGNAPAQLMVNLLTRLGRHEGAIDVFLSHLRNADPAQLTCPNVSQLCQMAGAFNRLKQVSLQENDLLSFAAATLQSLPSSSNSKS